MQIPRELPTMTIEGGTLFPGAVMPLYIFEPRYRRMLKDVLAGPRVFVVACQRPARVREAPAAIAGLGLVRAAVTRNDGTGNLFLQGLVRVRLLDTVRTRPYRVCTVDPLETAADPGEETSRLTETLLNLVSTRLDQGLQVPPAVLKEWTDGKGDLSAGELSNTFSLCAVKDSLHQLARIGDAGQLADLVACALLPGSPDRQRILETLGVEQRLQRVIRCVRAEIRRRAKQKDA